MRRITAIYDSAPDLLGFLGKGHASDGVPLRYKSHDRPVDDVLSALVKLCYQRPAAEKANENAIAKDKALAGDFDGLFREALKVIR